MSHRRARPELEPYDRQAVVALALDRAERGRWPTAAERPDLAGRDGVRTIGPAGHPSCSLMPTDPVVAERVAADPMLTAAWSASDADRWAAAVATTTQERTA